MVKYLRASPSDFMLSQITLIVLNKLPVLGIDFNIWAALYALSHHRGLLEDEMTEDEWWTSQMVQVAERRDCRKEVAVPSEIAERFGFSCIINE
jgi:hypothetical protein